MLTKTLLLGCSLSLVLIASPATQSSAAERRSSNTCGAIQVSSPEGSSTAKKRRGRKLPAFSASNIVDLQLQVPLSPAVKGDHRLELKLYTPKGHLYQSLPATISTSASKDQENRRDYRTRMATAILPVAGTTIVNNSLYGEWRVEAFLDGERETSCARAQSFVIEP